MVASNVSAVLEEDYEAQRAANIAANVELMKSLGLYQTSSSFSPSRPTKPKSTPTVSTASVEGGEYTPAKAVARVERPKRITRSASRTLDTPVRVSGRRKRAASDEPPHSSYTRSTSVYSSDSDSDTASGSTRRRTKRRLSSTPYNRDRHYRTTSDLQRNADRLGVRLYDPKTFGSIPGVPVGTLWSKRMDCSTASIHAPTVAGISGNADVGCWSICLSGGYEDDVDEGTTFTYTGSGGRDLKGTKQNPKNLRTAPQSKDQEWDGKNAALRKSVKTGKPVRVVRGYKGNNEFSPREGYVYSGLYRVTQAWMERGAAGWKVCKFRFERLPGQASLPVFDHSAPTDDEDDDDADDNAHDNDDDEKGEQEVEEVSARAIRALNRAKPSSTSSPKPSPSTTSPTAAEFDRTAYIVISDTEDDVDEGQVLMQLELPSAEVHESAAPIQLNGERRSRRRSSRRA